MATIDELRALAREIREERQIGGNTGERVGNTFEKVADLIESTGGDISDIRDAVEQLLQDVGFIPRDVSRTATDAVFTNSEGELLFWLRAATDTLAGLITAANNNKLIALPTAEELAQALAAKQNRLTFDPRPIEGSTNPVTSDGINTAIANFVTRSVSDLIYYYTKSETYTKEEVNALVAAIKQFVPVVAQTLPTASADTMYKLYLIPSEDPQESNIKDEYITIDNGVSANPRYTWEKIGSVNIDISGKADIGTVPADVTRTQTDATFVNNNHEPLFYLRQATSSLAGLMTSAEHTKLSALPTAQTLNTKLEGTIYDVSVLHPTSGVGGGNTYASLSAALAVIPQDKRKGGMTVRYVYSYDNKYHQYRLTAEEFSTDVEDWEEDDITNLQNNVAFINKSFGKYDGEAQKVLSQAKSGKYVNVNGGETSASGYGISSPVTLNAGDILLVPSAQAVPADVSVIARLVDRTYQKVIAYIYTYRTDYPELPATATADYDSTLVYTAVYDESGDTPVLTGWTRGGETYTTLPATREVNEQFYEPLMKQAVAAMPSTGYYIYLCPTAMTVVISGYTATVSGGVALVVGWGIFKNITTNFVGAPGQSVLAQAFAVLFAAIDGLKAQLENLGETKAVSIDFENSPKLCGQDMYLTGSGAPVSPMVPTMVGQEYLDVTNKKCYKAFSVTGAISDWVLLN